MNGPLTRYRVMASIVGVLLIVLCLVGLPLHYGHHLVDAAWLAEPAISGDEGTAGWGYRLGADISAYLGVAHGWLYMIFLFTAFQLARREEWELPYTAVTLLSGTVPVLSFWAEHRATQRVRREAAVPEPAPAP